MIGGKMIVFEGNISTVYGQFSSYVREYRNLPKLFPEKFSMLICLFRFKNFERNPKKCSQCIILTYFY